jgi:hypothetical protein
MAPSSSFAASSARLVFLLMACGLASAGCVTKDQLASQLEKSMRQDYLPKVNACWEREFESAGFRGEYVAVVDFKLAGGTGQIRDVVIRELRPTDDSPAAGADASAARLGGCLEPALRESSIASSGWVPSYDLTVKGFRFAFADASAKARQDAEQTSAHVLIGPRADRCLGLYVYDPPRDAAVLLTELTQAQAAVGRAEPTDRAAKARAWQRIYDLGLELRARLAQDVGQRGLKEANRERTRQAQSEAEETAREAGAQIRCQVPELER